MPKRWSAALAFIAISFALPLYGIDIYLNGTFWGTISGPELSARLPDEGALPLSDALPLMENLTLFEISAEGGRRTAAGGKARPLMETVSLSARDGVTGFVADGEWLPGAEAVYLEGKALTVPNGRVIVWLLARDTWLEEEINLFCRFHKLQADITIHPRMDTDLWAIPDGKPLPDLIVMDTRRFYEILRLLPDQGTSESLFLPGHTESLKKNGKLKAVPLYYTIPVVLSRTAVREKSPQELAGSGTLLVDARSFDTVWPLLGFKPGQGEPPFPSLLKNLMTDIKEGRVLLPGNRSGKAADREIVFSDRIPADGRIVTPLTDYLYRGVPLRPLAIPLLAAAGTPGGAGGRLLSWLTGFSAQGTVDTKSGRFPARLDVMQKETRQSSGMAESDILPPDPWLLAWKEYYDKTGRLVLSGEMTMARFEDNRPRMEDFKE